MTGAEIVPLVGGDQAIGIAVSSIGRGVVIRTCDRSIHQPRLNSNPSLWTFKPQSRKRDCVQSSALRIADALVSRAPDMSERYCDVCITGTWLVPSSLIRLTARRSRATSSTTPRQPDSDAYVPPTATHPE